MKSRGALLFLFVCFTFSISCLAQSPPFDLTDYQEFLDLHRNMTASELLQLHSIGSFKDNVDIPWESVLHRDVIEASYELTAYEKALLRSNGFVVSERLRNDSFVGHLSDIWRDDLPLYISTDAILHAVHYYYDTILVQIERGVLCNHLVELLSKMHETLPELSLKYIDDDAMLPMIEDVDLYLTVARRLLGESTAHGHFVDGAVVNEILNLVDAETLAVYSLFSQMCREIDFSQFKPRGHYCQSEDLKNYFQAMIWLGRTELYLRTPQNVASGPCPLQRPEDIQRQTIDATLMVELMDLANVNQLYGEMEAILSFLVGEQDNVTPAQLRYVLDSVHIYDARQLLDTATLEVFQQALEVKPFAFQRIQSQVLRCDPTAPGNVQPASAFMLFGQRFIIDSYITANVVFDKITHQGHAICRLFPSTLDVLAGLGNNVAMELLVPELNAYHYSSNLAALRHLVDSHDAAFWDSSVYNMWLNAIRTLNPPLNRDHLPVFMQTAAWWRQKLNTQLASWTQLRHDNLLYAKQSYTYANACSYPCAYVEPFPECFQCLNKLAVTARNRFSNLSFSDTDLKNEILDYYELLGNVTDTLATIARKELDGVSLAEDEITFMQEMLYRGGYSVLKGWYMLLLNGPSYIPRWIGTNAFSDYVVADYHTTPTDCGGTNVGWVLHAGTGPVDLAIVVAQAPDARPAAFVGPVMSYYEITTTDFHRLTDEEWENIYLSEATRPAWTSSFLANESGESY